LDVLKTRTISWPYLGLKPRLSIAVTVPDKVQAVVMIMKSTSYLPVFGHFFLLSNLQYLGQLYFLKLEVFGSFTFSTGNLSLIFDPVYKIKFKVHSNYMLVPSIFINFNFFYDSNYLQLSPDVSQDTLDILDW
jgi:hypothetical protein